MGSISQFPFMNVATFSQPAFCAVNNAESGWSMHVHFEVSLAFATLSFEILCNAKNSDFAVGT